MKSFEPLTVVRVFRDVRDAVHIDFEVPEAERERFRYAPGQYLTLKIMRDGIEHRRTYSIVSGPGDRTLGITVKRVEGGVVSNHINDCVAVGDVIECQPPEGRFTLPPSRAATDAASAKRHVLAIAAGSGITPIISMLQHGLATDPTAHFSLIYGNRDTASILFRDALADLKDRYTDRLSLFHVLSREQQEAGSLSGRISPDIIKRVVTAAVPIARLELAFLCGPDTLIKSAMDTLKELGVPREKIRFEFFTRGRPQPGSAPPAAEKPRAPSEAAHGPLVTAVLDGRQLKFRLQPGETVIEGAVRQGLSLPYSCRGGMCCTCRAKVTSGAGKMRANYSLQPWEIEAGFILTCQTEPTTPEIGLDYDAV